MDNYISESQFRRLQVTKGDTWWVDTETNDGLICLFCDKLIDWAPGDHELTCPVRRFALGE